MVYRILYLAIWITFTVIRIPYARAYKKIKKEKIIRSRLEKFLVFLNFIGMCLLPLGFIIFPTPEVLRIPLHRWAVVVSSIVLAMSLLLFYFVHKSLGRNWSPVLEIHEGHKLIQRGVYRYIRHPMYTQLWIFVIFQGLMLQNWVVEIYGILAWAVLYFIRVPAEEKMLIETFGSDYKEYMEKAGRLLPAIIFSINQRL